MTVLEHSDRLLTLPKGTWLRVTTGGYRTLPVGMALRPGDRLQVRRLSNDGTEMLICWHENGQPVWLTRAQCAAVEVEGETT